MASFIRTSPSASTLPSPALKKFTVRLQPGSLKYLVHHNLGTEEVMVQTRMDGRVREAEIIIVDKNTLQVCFGSAVFQPVDVVVIG